MPVKAHIYPARSVWQSTKSLPKVKLSLADHRGRREPLTVTPGRVVEAGRCWSPIVAIVSSMPCELFRSRRMLSTFRSSLYCWREHVITRSSSVWMIVFRATSMTMFCEFANSVERDLKKLFWFYFNCVVYVLTCTDDVIFCRNAYISMYTRSQRNSRSGVSISQGHLKRSEVEFQVNLSSWTNKVFFNHISDFYLFGQILYKFIEQTMNMNHPKNWHMQLKSLCFIYIGVIITSVYMCISVFNIYSNY